MLTMDGTLTAKFQTSRTYCRAQRDPTHLDNHSERVGPSTRNICILKSGGRGAGKGRQNFEKEARRPPLLPVATFYTNPAAVRHPALALFLGFDFRRSDLTGAHYGTSRGEHEVNTCPC